VIFLGFQKGRFHFYIMSEKKVSLPKIKTPSFVTEIPLIVTPPQEQALLKRFEAGRQIYNACLGESLKRLDLMRQSKAWQKVRKLPAGKSKADAFKSLHEQFGFRKYDLLTYAQRFGHEWLGNHLDSRTVKRLAGRAFTWAKEYLFDPDRGKPKFRRFGELNSVESINNLQGIVWRDNQVIWSAGRNGSKLVFDTLIDHDNPVIQHGLSCRIKYVRLVRRVLNGKNRFYAQLVNEGKPYQRFELEQGIVGLDIGPSTVAIVGPNEAHLKQFCAELEDSQAEIRRLQRKVDRQRRANNPGNYNENGTVKPRGQRSRWITSNRQRQTEIALTELKRKQAEYRKSLHGQLVNRILQMGDVVKLEKLSYRAFQKMWGKSVGMRAPGMFVARLKQKVNDYGGLVDEFSTYHTRLSQTCHGCGQIIKKELSQRWHKCDCGVVAQRDLYSAFLATCVEDDTFNAIIANEQWSGVGPLLQAALNDIDQAGPSSFGLNRQVAADRLLAAVENG